MTNGRRKASSRTICWVSFALAVSKPTGFSTISLLVLLCAVSKPAGFSTISLLVLLCAVSKPAGFSTISLLVLLCSSKFRTASLTSGLFGGPPLLLGDFSFACETLLLLCCGSVTESSSQTSRELSLITVNSAALKAESRGWQGTGFG